MTKKERVAYYEVILDQATIVADQMETALQAYEAVQGNLKKLESYYAGPKWKEDYEADEAGLFPADLKRGVLSQDAVYDLLERYQELESRMREILSEEEPSSDDEKA